MSFFSSPKKPKFGPPPAAPPIRVQPDVELAKKNIRESLLRARGRAASQVTSGPLAAPNLLKTGLKDRLG